MTPTAARRVYERVHALAGPAAEAHDVACRLVAAVDQHDDQADRDATRMLAVTLARLLADTANAVFDLAAVCVGDDIALEVLGLAARRLREVNDVHADIPAASDDARGHLP